MLTDAPPHNANRARFLESDRIKTLNLPQDGRWTSITESIESALKAGQNADIRRACVAFLQAASDFYDVPHCGVRVLAARPLRVRESWSTELFGDYTPETMLIRVLDANGGAEGSHVVWYVREHPLPRVLPPSGLSGIWVSRFVAHSRLLRAGGCSVPSCAGHADEDALLGARGRRALAH